jgi:hypothetical protein
MEETFEQKLARILATPLPPTDINTPYTFVEVKPDVLAPGKEGAWNTNL